MRPNRLRPVSLALALGAVASGLVVTPRAAAETAPAPPAHWYEEQPATVGPRIEVLAPAEWGDQERAKVRIEVRIHDVDDPAEAVDVRAALDDEEFVEIAFDEEAGTHQGFVDLAGRDEGGHQLRVVAEDPAGHTTTLAGSISGVLLPRAALLGAWSGRPTVSGDVPVQVLASDPQTPAEDLEVRVGAATPGVLPYELGDESDQLTYDPVSGTFRGTWDSTVVPNGSTWTERGTTFDAWPMVVEVTDPDGLTDAEGVLVHPVNATSEPDEDEVVGFRSAGPVRLLDTRPASAVGTSGGAPAAGRIHRVAVPTHAALGLEPGDDAAVALSVTATQATVDGWVTVWPCGSNKPLASTINVTPGQTAANLVMVQPGESRQVCASTSSPMHLLVDLTGTIPAESGFRPVQPSRRVDTRDRSSATPGRDAVTVVPVIGDEVGHVGTAQVALNVTATGSKGPGWVTVTSCDDRSAAQRFLTTSNLNVDRAGQTVANLVVSEVGAAKTVCVYASVETHVVVDQLGWWPASTLSTAHGPLRLVDTRSARGALQPGEVLRVRATGNAMVPADSVVSGVVANVTLTGASRAGWVTVWPCGSAKPWTSNLNVDRAGQTVAASVAVGLDTTGDLCVAASGGGHVVVDLSGWFPAPTDVPWHSTAVAPAPAPAALAPAATTPPPATWGLGKVTVAPDDPSDDLVWYRPPDTTHAAVGRTWDGELHGVVVLEDHDLGYSWHASPDGTLFMSAYQLIRADGLELGYWPHWNWADDNQHACDLSYQRYGAAYGDPYRLDVVDLDRNEWPIADLPQQEGNYISLLSCSVVHDRAVIVINPEPRREAVVIRLSDGARLAPPLLCTNPTQVTHDGRFLLSQNPDRSYHMCDLDTGLLVHTFPPAGPYGWGGVGLNGDGSQAYVYGLDRSCGYYDLDRIVSVATGATLWSSSEEGQRQPCAYDWRIEASHHAGPETMLGLGTVDGVGFDEMPVYVVGADGRPRQIAGAGSAREGSFRPDRWWW